MSSTFQQKSRQTKKIIIANWKMKLNLDETVDLAKEIIDGYKKVKLKEQAEVVLCPSFIAMNEVARLIKAAGIKLGAQDVFWQENGAYTGEISVEMLKNLGCEYFIIGHSERRQYLKETDEMINKKIKAVLKNGGTPIVCVGETGNERQDGKKEQVVMNQVSQAFRDIKIIGHERIIVAYEPVWVIGAGQAVEPQEAEYMINLIRRMTDDFCQNEASLRIIYGGSADSGNIRDFIGSGKIDGFLVGGASLDGREFISMANILANSI